MVVDIFRFDETCKIVEHWDVTQTEVTANKTASGHDMGGCLSCGTGGLCDFAPQPKIAAGLGLLTRGFNGFELSEIKILIGNVYYQHDPLFADGFDAMENLLTELYIAPRTRPIFSPVRAFAANDLVFIHSHYAVDDHFMYAPNGTGKVVVDIFRFNVYCLIVEHGSVVETVVDALQSANGNDMFGCVTCVQ